MFMRLFVLFAVACAGGIKDGVTDTEPETAPFQEGRRQQDDNSSGLRPSRHPSRGWTSRGRGLGFYQISAPLASTSMSPTRPG